MKALLSLALLPLLVLPASAFALEVQSGLSLATTTGSRSFAACTVDFEIQQADAAVDALFFGIAPEADVESIKEQLQRNVHASFSGVGVLFAVKAPLPTGADSPATSFYTFWGAWNYSLGNGGYLYAASGALTGLHTFAMAWSGDPYFYRYNPSSGQWQYSQMSGSSYQRGVATQTCGSSNCSLGSMIYCASSSCTVDFLQTWYSN